MSIYQDAALVEPLACVLRGLEETNIQPGDNVAVMGLGPIGSMFVRLAKVSRRARDRDRTPAEPVGSGRAHGCGRRLGGRRTASTWSRG